METWHDNYTWNFRAPNFGTNHGFCDDFFVSSPKWWSIEGENYEVTSTELWGFPKFGDQKSSFNPVKWGLVQPQEAQIVIEDSAQHIPIFIYPLYTHHIPIIDPWQVMENSSSMSCQMPPFETGYAGQSCCGKSQSSCHLYFFKKNIGWLLESQTGFNSQMVMGQNPPLFIHPNLC